MNYIALWANSEQPKPPELLTDAARVDIGSIVARPRPGFWVDISAPQKPTPNEQNHWIQQQEQREIIRDVNCSQALRLKTAL